jgi:hypothetical protein
LARPVILNPLPGWLGLKNQPFLTLYLRKIFFGGKKKTREKRAFFKVVALDWLSSNAVHHSGGEYTIDVAAVYRYLC